MLKAPYEKIYTEGDNNYYYLKFADNPVTFLAIETVEHAIEKRHRRWRKPKTVEHEITVGVKLLPLTAICMFLIVNALNTTPAAISEDGEVFSSWNEFDVKDIRDSFKAYLDAIGDTRTYDMPHTFKNHVVKGFMNDLRKVFPVGIENHGIFRRTIWMTGLNSYGHLSIIRVDEVGKKMGDTVTNYVSSIILDRGVMKIIMDDFEKGLFTRDSESIDVVEDDPAGLDLTDELVDVDSKGVN
jgi:hypothetical protein